MTIPAPAQFSPGHGHFTLNANTRITASAELLAEARQLAAALRPATGFPLPVSQSLAQGHVINFAVDSALAAEEYQVTVTEADVTITAAGGAGAFYAAQVLQQLLPPQIYRRATTTGVTWQIPVCEIADRPRFGWRGVMLDVSRHFMPKADVLRFIDLAAMHRLNVFHWHLTDDQGWRIEIKRYPKLTEVGSWRRESQVGAQRECAGNNRPHGGFYTQDDVREIVAYAAERHITVIPEIEMPGHVQAAIAAYPELGVAGQQIEVGTRWGIIEDVCNIERSTVEFFCQVLDEVAELFPADIIHVGGDECPKVQWENDVRTRELMADYEIADINSVQPWFMAQIGAHLEKLGKRMAGWDEILEGPVPERTIISSWRGLTGAVTAARRGCEVVSCPTDPVYLDFRQSDGDDEPIPVAIPVDIARAYSFEPVPAQLTADEARFILGGQANVWTEHMDSPRTVDFFTFPRLAAIAEALWATHKNYDDFWRRLPAHLARLDVIGVEYRPLDGPRPWQRRPGIPGRPTSLAEWEAFINELVANIRE